MEESLSGGTTNLLRMARSGCQSAVAFVALSLGDQTFATATYPTGPEEEVVGADTVDDLVRQLWLDPGLGQGKALVRTVRLSGRRLTAPTKRFAVAAVPLGTDEDRRPWGILGVADPETKAFGLPELELLARIAQRLASYVRARHEIRHQLAVGAEGGERGAPARPAVAPGVPSVPAETWWSVEPTAPAVPAAPAPAVPAGSAPAVPAGSAPAPGPATGVPAPAPAPATTPTFPAPPVRSGAAAAEHAAGAPAAPAPRAVPPFPPPAGTVGAPPPGVVTPGSGLVPPAPGTPPTGGTPGTPRVAGGAWSPVGGRDDVGRGTLASSPTAERVPQRSNGTADTLGQLLGSGALEGGLVPLGAFLARTGRLLGAGADASGALAVVVLDVAGATGSPDELVTRAARALRAELRFDDPLTRIGRTGFAVAVSLVPGGATGDAVETRLAAALQDAMPAQGDVIVRAAHVVADLRGSHDADELVRAAVGKLRAG